MSRRVDWLMVLVSIALFNTESSLGKLVLEGSAELVNGFRTLTNTKKHVYGQAFNDEPFPFRNSTNGNVTSFSLTLLFAIVPEHMDKGSHDMAFVISPTRGIPGAFADQYLGIFNDTNNGKRSNHIIAVELDIHKDDEFGDIDDNHVGININGMRSTISAPAGYYDQKGQFKNISLISGNLLRVTMLYSQEEKQLNVTLSSPEDYYPNQPLLFLNQDLSPYLLEKMYVGCTASTGSIGALHYVSTPDSDVYAFGLFMLEVSCGRRLIEPRAATSEVVLAEWALECWEKGDILEAANEIHRQEHNKEHIELVLILGVLCSHQVAGVRPDMSKVVQILNGDLQLPDNLLDIVKAEKVRMWSDTSERVLDVLTSQESIGTLTFTEPFISRGRRCKIN